jgi:hypothetical protein
MVPKLRKIGRPKKQQGPKLQQVDEVERLLVEGEVVPGPDGEATRVWLSQRDIAARFNVSTALIADFAKKHRTTERRVALRAQLDTPKSPPEDPMEKRKPGRPRHQDAPVIPWEELDRALVFGEVQILEDGKHTTFYPSYRTLAERYGVVVSVIAEYAKSHNTMKRRKETAARVAVRTEEKLIELRAESLAVGEDRLVAMIDDFLLKFEGALKEGRVRTDSPTDVNTLARLKQFIMGGADSRQEVRNILSLEALQERYARMAREAEFATPAMAGVIESNKTLNAPCPPSRALGDSVGETNTSGELSEETEEDE